jgi:hypothetical protein
MRIGSRTALLTAALILGAGAACAADSTTRPRSMPPAPEAPGPGAGSSDAPPSGTSQDPSSLSDKLSRSGGVLQPPATVDPAMKQPAPPTGPQSMPVIPPPGTPGNDQGVRPK